MPEVTIGAVEGMNRGLGGTNRFGRTDWRRHNARMPNEPVHVPNAFERFAPWRRSFEIGAWLGITAVNAVANSITTVMDLRRLGEDVAPWQPVVWEASSAALMLVLIPLLVLFTRRYPLHWGGWRVQLGRHLAASIVFSLVHVLGMVGLRTVAYAMQGEPYDFGPWPRELLYEYLKDVRSYVFIVIAVETYRWLLRRLQGEARLLDAPDDGGATETVERPERFLVRKLRREFLVEASDIEWAQASGNYVNLHVRGHDYPLRSTIAGVESRLDPDRFARVHRSYLVNLGHVASIEPLDTGDARIHMRDAAVVPCSRRYRNSLRERLGVEG